MSSKLSGSETDSFSTKLSSSVSKAGFQHECSITCNVLLLFLPCSSFSLSVRLLAFSFGSSQKIPLSCRIPLFFPSLHQINHMSVDSQECHFHRIFPFCSYGNGKEKTIRMGWNATFFFIFSLGFQIRIGNLQQLFHIAVNGTGRKKWGEWNCNF